MKGLKEIVMAVSVLGALAAPAFSAATKSQQQLQMQQQMTVPVAVKRPNLVIPEARAVPGDDRKLKAHVVNIGQLAAGACNLKLFYVRSGKVMVVNTPVPAMPAGGEHWLTVSIGSPIAYAQNVYLRVDDPNHVTESSELDNALIYK
jgi:hypothetical protein